jgi:hypothetical protein
MSVEFGNLCDVLQQNVYPFRDAFHGERSGGCDLTLPSNHSVEGSGDHLRNGIGMMASSHPFSVVERKRENSKTISEFGEMRRNPAERTMFLLGFESIISCDNRLVYTKVFRLIKGQGIGFSQWNFPLLLADQIVGWFSVSAFCTSDV